jgi:hypothetical protein
MTLISCTSDLDVTPGDDDYQFFFQDPASLLAKLYAGLYVGVMTETDQQILPDLEETLVVTYVFFVMQELPTDEAIIAWQMVLTNNEYSNLVACQ